MDYKDYNRLQAALNAAEVMYLEFRATTRNARDLMETYKNAYAKVEDGRKALDKIWRERTR